MCVGGGEIKQKFWLALPEHAHHLMAPPPDSDTNKFLRWMKRVHPESWKESHDSMSHQHLLG